MTMLTEGLGHWGLGIEVGGGGDDIHFAHGGDDWGFKAIFMAWPKGGRGIVVMANGDDGTTVIREVMQALAREYGWKGVEPRILLSAVLSEAQRTELVGSFGQGRATISWNGSALRASYAGGEFEVVPLAGGTLVIDPDGLRMPLKIIRGADGRIRSVDAGGLVFARDR